MSHNILAKRTMLNSLTSFRFFAVLLVFIFHVGISSKYQTGYVGVSFFFILSGFILTYNYKLTFKQELDIYEIKKFYIARIVKVYPIHILTFFLVVPYYFLIPLKHEPILYIFQAMTNLTLIHSFIPFGNISFNGVSWNLSNELFFTCFFHFELLSQGQEIYQFVMLIQQKQDRSLNGWQKKGLMKCVKMHGGVNPIIQMVM